MQVWVTPDRNGRIRTTDNTVYEPAALPLSYAPLQGGQPCQSISEKPPTFTPLASIVLYNELSEQSELFHKKNSLPKQTASIA